MKKITLSLALGFTLVPTLALAHAHLHSSEPKADSTVAKMPDLMKLDFSEKIEPKFSSVKVLDSTGHDFSDKIALNEKDPLEVIVSLHSGATPGKYQVQWKALSIDSHKTNGAFFFNFQPK